MITLPTTVAAALAALVAAWTLAAGWILVVGLQRADAARTARREADRFGALIAGAPAIPMLVRPDGEIQTSERLLDWLGTPSLPRFLADFADRDGVVPEDADALVAAARDAQLSAGRFTVTLGVPGSERRLVVEGRPSPSALGGPGTLLLWFFDASENARTIGELSAQVDRLAEALDALAALIEAAPIPMWHRGSDLRLGLVNSAYVRAVEAVDAHDVIARGVELVEGQNGGGPQASAAEAQAAGRTVARNMPATVAGERRMLKVVDVPLGPAGIAGYAVDVEELEQAKADLLRFGRAQRDMLDRLSAGVAQFGPDHMLVFCNQPFQRMFAFEVDWLADSPEFDRVLERMREGQRLPESRDFPSWKAERRGWFNSPDEAIEESWLLPGGQHLRVVAQPLPDGGLLLIFEDRTEQLQLASARDTLLRVRTATFDNLFEAIGVFAADGRLRIWNNRFRQVWALDETALVEHPRIDSFVEMVAPRLATPARAGLIRELVRIATIERQQRSGRVQLIDGRDFEFAAVPLPDGNALFTMLDVTDSRRVESALRESNQALEEADRVKSAFVANVSYELRTPLTSIAGFAEMLAGDYAGALAPAQREYVEAILSSVGRLGTLIDDVLDFTQSEAGQLPLAADPVAVAPLVRAVVGEQEAAATADGIRIEIKANALAGSVHGDRQRLSQALGSLVAFARARSVSGGVITVTASGTAEQAEITVRDDGPPVDASALAGVFTPLPTAPAPSAGESQLAMPLARRFVEAHGGTVDLRSAARGGTTVTVRLPREMPPR